METSDVRIDETARIKYFFLHGDHISIDMSVYCAVRLIMGNWIHIAPHVSIIGGEKSSLVIGDCAGISTGARIICGSEDFVNSLLGFMPEKYRTVVHGNNIIQNFAWVGADAVILPNIIVAEGSVIGAGAVVTKNTEPWMVYVGNPARAIKPRNKEKILNDYLQMQNEYKP